ncbi:uncharacterized protein LOC134848502 [Symsagittifera roscoffensis]|uniref:uncharacterized protein LOC134848502 n=1 Tax=Symsagittifera roscoffensis TaxID=84072 RepID=UPI00307BD04C
MNFLRALKRAIFGKSSPNEHLHINVKSKNIYNSNRDCEDLLNQKIPENGSYFDIYGLIGDQGAEHDQSDFKQSKHEFEKQTFQSWPPKNKIGKYNQSRPNEYVHIAPESPKDAGKTKALDTTLRELLQEIRQDLQDQPYFDGKIKMPDAARLLKKYKIEGSFLVRNSRNQDGLNFAITFFSSAFKIKSVKSIGITFIPAVKKWRMGHNEIPNERQFNKVSDCVEFIRSKRQTLTSGEEIELSGPLTKELIEKRNRLSPSPI